MAAFVGSILADLVILGVFRLMAEGPPLDLPIDLILPAAVLNAALTGVLLYPSRLLAPTGPGREAGMVMADG